MHSILVGSAKLGQQRRQERNEAAWAIAAITLVSLLLCAIVAACYPMWC